MNSEANDAPAISSSRRRLLRWIFVGVILFFTTVVLELLLQLIAVEVRNVKQAYRHGGLVQPYKPGADFEVLGEEFRVHYQINELGFRETPWPPTPSPENGKVRGLVLGDSFGEGWGVEIQQRFDRLIEASEPLELINLSAAGGSQIQELILLRRFASQWNAKFLILQVFDNDLLDNSLILTRFERDASGRIGTLPERMDLREASVIEGIQDWLGERELIAVSRQLRQILAGQAIQRGYFVRPGSMKHKVLLDRASAEARFAERPEVLDLLAKDCKDVHFYDPSPESQEQWRPLLELNESLLEQILEEARKQGLETILLYVPDRRVFRGRNRSIAAKNPLREQLLSFSKKHGLPLLDIQGAWSKDPEQALSRYFVFDGHWNEAGHRAAAEGLAEILRDRLKTPR